MTTGTEVKTAFASEGGRFYMPDGGMLESVPNKSKPGESRPATVRDALKVGAEPSVTSILKVAAAPQLTAWLIQQALDAALTLPRIDGESLDDFKARALRDSQEQSRKARDRGTEIHAAIEQACRGEIFKQEFSPHVEAVYTALKDAGIDLSDGKPERSFCVPGGWGGKIDWSDEAALLDFKGVEDSKLDGKLGYDEHIRQLAAYDHGLDKQAGSIIVRHRRLINVFISRETGRVRLREWTKEEAVQALAEFKALLRFYRLSKGFDKP